MTNNDDPRTPPRLILLTATVVAAAGCTGTSSDDAAGDTGGASDAPMDDVPDDDGGAALPLEGELVVAYGRGDGSFVEPLPYPVEADGLVKFSSRADGSELATWNGPELCVRRMEGRRLDPPSCIDSFGVDGTDHLDVLPMAADVEPPFELLAVGRDPDTDGAVASVIHLVDDQFVDIDPLGGWALAAYPGGVVADFDADGIDEAFLAGIEGDCASDDCAFASVWIHPDQSDPIQPVEAYGYPVAGALDDDGIVDLMVGARFYPGATDQLPTDQLHALATFSVPTFSPLADLDGDGRAELVRGTWTPPTLDVVETPIDPLAPETTPVEGGEGRYLGAGDFDGDGRDEVISLAPATPASDAGEPGPVVARLTEATTTGELVTRGAFQLCDACVVAPAYDPAEPDGNVRRRVLVDDLDGDGHLDVAVATQVRPPR